jgi:hypothetical protein
LKGLKTAVNLLEWSLAIVKHEHGINLIQVGHQLRPAKQHQYKGRSVELAKFSKPFFWRPWQHLTAWYTSMVRGQHEQWDSTDHKGSPDTFSSAVSFMRCQYSEKSDVLPPKFAVLQSRPQRLLRGSVSIIAVGRVTLYAPRCYRCFGWYIFRVF